MPNHTIPDFLPPQPPSDPIENHRDNGLTIHDSFELPITPSTRWYNAPRGWQRNISGTGIDSVRIGRATVGYEKYDNTLVIAIENDVHHMLLDRQQAARLARILNRYARTGVVSQE